MASPSSERRHVAMARVHRPVRAAAGGVAVGLAFVVWLAGPEPAPAQTTARALVGRALPGDARLDQVEAAIDRFRQRDPEGCKERLVRARHAEPRLPPPGVLMAALWLGAGQLPLARAELEETVVQFPGDPEPYLVLGDLAFGERRITEADLLFAQAAALAAPFAENPRRRRDFEVRVRAGTAAVAEARRQWEKARRLIAEWLELDPDNAGAHQRLGVVLFQLGQERESLAAFREARSLDEHSVQPELAVARLHDAAGRPEAGGRVIDDAVRAAPDDAGVQLAAAQWRLGRGDLAAAQASADRALALAPRSLEGRIVRGAIARAARDFPTAERLFGEAHAQAPASFVAADNLALVLVERTDADARRRAAELAEANAARARDLPPQQITALTTLAWVYYKSGRREDAERILDQIARSHALTSDGAFYVATLLVDRGDRERAQAILEQVLATEPMFATRPDASDLLAKLKKDTP